MLAQIVQADMLITAEAKNADVVVVNTCGFIAPAKAEALETIREALEWKANSGVKKIIVTGCLPQRLGDELLSEIEGIDAIVGLGQRDNIASIITKTLTSKKSAAYLAQSPDIISDDRTRLLITPRHWAYLRISEGCNHRCSFCTIPAIRGRFRSKGLDVVLTEAAELADAGVVELNIIAQDTAYWGRDLKIKDGLAQLVSKLEKITGPKWLRLMYLQPAGITEKLIETIVASKKIVHYFDIPIQHVNNKILKGMRRSDTKEGICRLIEKLRIAMPDVVLRTTLMVGFPGESDEQFAELLDFVKWAKFDALGCFKYYAESGTAAAEMAGQVDNAIKQQRLDELMLAQQEIAFAGNNSRLGTEFECLIDSLDGKGSGRGRFYGQAPDIDGVCIVKNCSAKAGQFVDTKVIDTKGYDLLVEQI